MMELVAVLIFFTCVILWISIVLFSFVRQSNVQYKYVQHLKANYPALYLENNQRADIFGNTGPQWYTLGVEPIRPIRWNIYFPYAKKAEAIEDLLRLNVDKQVIEWRRQTTFARFLPIVVILVTVVTLILCF